MGPWLVDVSDRVELDPWLGGGPTFPPRGVVMLVRGDSELVREFLPNALDAAKLDGRRIVLWLKDEGILSVEERERFFGADDDIVAAVLDPKRQVKAWVYRSQLKVADAAFAFDRAG